MMVLFASVRAIHFAACLLLTAVWVFEFAVIGRRADATPEAAAFWNRIARRLLLWGWLAAVISGALWFWLVSQEMAGVSWREALAPAVLGKVWNLTDFGAAWRWRAVCCGAAIVMIAGALLAGGRLRRVLGIPALFLSAAFLAGLAWAGHARVGPDFHLPVDVVHLLAGACWPAGLVPLLLVIRSSARMPPRERLAFIAPLTKRFSALALLSVAVLVGSGIVNSCLLLRSPGGFVHAPYGRTLFAKIAVFLVAAGIGAVNLRMIKPRILAEAESREDAGEAIGWLGRNVAAEAVLAGLVVGLVGLLGLLAPAPP